MDRKAVAKELRQRLFDFIESERKEALQDEAIDKLFEGVLAKYDVPDTVTLTEEQLRAAPYGTHTIANHPWVVVQRGTTKKATAAYLPLSLVPAATE